MSTWIRQGRRQLSLIFPLSVIASFAAVGMEDGEPPAWITCAPLLPLFLLLFSGLYLFALPCAARRPGGARSPG